MAAGEGASQPKDWSVPKFGEDDPTLPTVPSTRIEKGVRIITPATISCYPLLEPEKPGGDDIGADEEIRIRSVNRYRGWRNALRTYVSCLYQFFKGESGFDMMMYPPSDRAPFEKLKLLQNNYNMGLGIRAEVFRAAIALAARDCSQESAYPIDQSALEYILPTTGGRMAAGGGEEELDSSELFGPDVFGPPPKMPNLKQLRGTVLFWGGDEASMIYRRQKGRKVQPTVDMDYVCPWPFLRPMIFLGASHATWTSGLRSFVKAYSHCLNIDAGVEENAVLPQLQLRDLLQSRMLLFTEWAARWMVGQG